MTTSTKPGEPGSIRVRSVGAELFLDDTAWPATALIAAECVDGQHVILRYPFLTLRLANAQATYRVETCEHGVWRGELVESWYHARQ